MDPSVVFALHLRPGLMSPYLPYAPTRPDLQVAIVTAAGYEQAQQFEGRLAGLLEAFKKYPPEITDRCGRVEWRVRVPC